MHLDTHTLGEMCAVYVRIEMGIVVLHAFPFLDAVICKLSRPTLRNLAPDIAHPAPDNTDHNLPSIFLAAVLPEAPATAAKDL